MNENINLCEILKGHEGETFWSDVFDLVILISVESEFIKIRWGITYINLYQDGSKVIGERCVLFPSKDQRDWNKWNKENNHRVPKTWSELINQNRYACYQIGYLNKDNRIYNTAVGRNSIEKSALSLLKIHQLIEAGYGGNVTKEEWVNSDGNNLIYVPFYNPIEKEFQSFGIFGLHRKSLIAFHTHKQIKEFLSKAENIELLKDYFMI